MSPQHLTGSVRECDSIDIEVIYGVINEAAKAYKPVLPWGVYHEPQMSMDELLEEMKRVKFLAYTEQARVLGVMGYEFVGEVALVRHAYVLPAAQRRGIGALLLNQVEDAIAKSGRIRSIIIGTYSAASWAISFYENHGYRKSANPQNVLRNYYDIPQVQRSHSLTLEKPTNTVA